MRFQIQIIGETDDQATIKDAVDLLQIQMPYMFDNVVVTSEDESEYGRYDRIEGVTPKWTPK